MWFCLIWGINALFCKSKVTVRYSFLPVWKGRSVIVASAMTMAFNKWSASEVFQTWSSWNQGLTSTLSASISMLQRKIIFAWKILYSGSPTNTVSTTTVFGLCTCKWGIFALVEYPPPTVPLTRISCNRVFSKSQNARKVGTLCIPK